MPTLVVDKKITKLNINLGLDTNIIRQSIPKLTVFMGIDTVLAEHSVPIITVYDDNFIEPPAIYVDAGLYNQEANSVDAGFYNTTSWQETWDARFS